MMDIQQQVREMDSLVARGAVVEAVRTFFAAQATTSDYEGVTTAGKEAMITKMEAFTGGIATVNGISHHGTLVDGYRSASEFTFDFAMKDGSRIYWHEIIRRDWNDQARVIREEYFLAGK